MPQKQPLPFVWHVETLKSLLRAGHLRPYDQRNLENTIQTLEALNALHIRMVESAENADDTRAEEIAQEVLTLLRIPAAPAQGS